MDLNKIKSKLNTLQTQGQKKEKVDYAKYLWKPKQEGKSVIRIVPSKNNKENPFKEVFIHYGFSKFPMYALTNWNEADPIVEFASELRKTNDKENWKLAKKLDPKMRIFAPVIVRGEEDKGVRLWEFGKEIYMQLLGIADDPDYGDYTDINEGRDFTVDTVTGDIGGGRQGLKSSIRIKPKQTPLGASKTEIEKFLADQPDILEIQRKMDYDKIKEVLQEFLTGDETSAVVEEQEVDASTSPFIEETAAPATKAKSSKADQFDDLFNEEK